MWRIRKGGPGWDQIPEEVAAHVIKAFCRTAVALVNQWSQQTPVNPLWPSPYPGAEGGSITPNRFEGLGALHFQTKLFLSRETERVRTVLICLTDCCVDESNGPHLQKD